MIRRIEQPRADTDANADALQPARCVDRDARYQRRTSSRPIDLRLDANEGGAFAAGLVREWSLDPDSVRRYPDARPLEVRIAQVLAIDASRVVVTAGADDALYRACRALLEPGRRAAYCVPTFEMIPRYVRACGAEGREVDWPSGAFPTDALIESERDAQVVFVVSPNNPTGAVATREDLLRLRESLPDALIVLDAAYGEFADDDLTEIALELPKTIVTRTFSKAWGAAGLRVGYAAGDARAIGWLRAVGQPYAVSNLSLAIASRLLEGAAGASRAYVARVKHERGELARLLRNLGAHPIDGQANFVLARFDDAGRVADLLEGLGIAVRRFTSSRLRDMLRIGCPGDDDAFARLTNALQAALAPQAILFDLDGVIADVSGSYREAIRRTAAAFGADVSPDDVATAKAAGDANNDWVLTHRLLARRGIDVPFERVKQRFESLYQSELWKNEPPLCTRATLESLRTRYPLAIVTGRPRCDAERFLRQHDLIDVFEAIVCMEDAPLKPDPAPLRLAMQILSVSRAWMLGDTPDDVRAARAAGVIPIGCVAPGESRERAEDVLLLAGAARVLTDISQLTEILP